MCYLSLPRQLITSLPPGLRMNVGPHLILINVIYGCHKNSTMRNLILEMPMSQASRYHAGSKEDMLRRVCFQSFRFARSSMLNRRRRLFPLCAHTLLCCISLDGTKRTFQVLSWTRLPLLFGRFCSTVIGVPVFKFCKINQEKIPDRLTEPYCTPFCMDELIP